MVRSKEVPKRPKDPLMTPPSKPRGFRYDDDGGFCGSLPRNRGGSAMSPAPASVPNYMRATSSSGAKAGPGRRAGAVASSASPTTRRGPARAVTMGRVLFPTPEVPGMVRATPTCSSTMKEAKFPGALDLAPGATDAQGPAAMRVCPYNYCSLNGHTHSPAVPLRSFLASRRRLIKTQQSMKHKGVSAFRKGSGGHQRPEDKKSGPVLCAAVAKAAPLVDEEALGDFFVEVYAGPRVSSDMSCSDMSLDEMDAAVRRMEFVVFDRCGVGEDDEKGGDPAVGGDGGRRPEEDRLGFCRDSSSECSDDAVSGPISGNLVEELPWMRYECDSLEDDVSEEHVQEAEVSEGQQCNDEEGGSSDNHEEEADEEQKPEHEEIISDLPRETGIVAEEEGVDCRSPLREDISNTMDQHEACTVQETQHEDGEERVSDVAHKMKIAAAQACIVCAAEVCNEQEEEEDQDNILGKVIQGDASDGQGTSAEKLSNGVDESEIPQHELDILGKVVQGDISDGQGTSEEQLSNGVCEPEIPENEVAESVENVVEESREEDGVADQGTKDDQSNVESTGNLEVTEKQDMPDHESEMEISETVPSVACEEDFVEEEVTSRAVSEGEISDCSAIASLDAEISTPPTEGGFEQDVNTVEDAFEQYDGAVNNFVDQCIPAEDTVDVTEDAEKQIEITSCNLEDASEESGTAQESSQEVTFLCVDATAQESSQEVNFLCVDGGAQMELEPEVTNCKLEDSSEESGIAQESSQDVKPVCVDAAAQTEPEPEVRNCKLEDSSEEESGIAQESSQDVKPVCVDAAVQMEPETTNYKLEGASAEAGITGETVHDDNLVYVGEAAQVQSGVDTSELVDTSEESGIAHEICEDDNSAYVSDDAQSDSGIATCELGEESANVQEADQDQNCTDVNGGFTNESMLTACELAEASEAYDITQEAIQDDNISDVNDGAQKESEIIACESEHACEESHIIQEGGEDVNAACEESDIIQEGVEDDNTACEESYIIQEGGEDGSTPGVRTGALKEPEIMASELADACEEVCITKEANISPVVQIPEHNYDLSATDGYGEPQNLPAEDTVAKEFSIDDMCNVFSGLNLKGDVYVDPTESEICPRNRRIVAGRRRTPEEDEYMRGFNPRAPNFLPLESDPDAEKVDLKHQTAEDRKNAEEWMIDYALRRAVNNLGPARKKKVELLVQAFETVLPQDEKKSISPTRPAQACN
ncbi:unnamed protein product [Triticum turgidum subsp. durum]|uniref:Calmodulin-binding domain-containing protein n=1 Tax=Triticum turgidum subsp. durum TaxID=4567 RepID=A0A9R0V8G3_TRITD|nr:unnamed protein product [Triticum turgidum subsp. durum]